MLIYFFITKQGIKSLASAQHIAKTVASIATPYLYIKDEINSSDKATTHSGSQRDWNISP